MEVKKFGISIRFLLVISFILLMVFQIIISSALIFCQYENKKIINNMKKDIFDNTLTFVELQKNIIQIERLLTNRNAAKKKFKYKEHIINAEFYRQNSQEILEKLLLKYIDNEINKNVNTLQEIKTYFNNYTSKGKLMFIDYKNGNDKEAEKKIVDFYDSSSKIQHEIEILINNHKIILNQKFTSLNSRFSTYFFSTIGVVVLSLLFSIILTIIISNYISKPIKKIVEVTNKMAFGDLTGKVLYKAKSELGDLCGKINYAILGLRTLVRDVHDSSIKNVELSTRVIKSSQDSTESLIQIASYIEIMKKKLNNLLTNIFNSTDSVKIINQNIKHLTNQIENQFAAVIESKASIEQMNITINEVTKIVKTKEEISSKLNEVINTGNSKVELTNIIVKDIAGLAEEMSKIIKVINTISNQTNMLSMNAAIEAAHAGEYGKGFSVVAEEIHNLASSTREYSKYISDSLKAIATKIETALEHSNESKISFDKINTEVSEFTIALSEITNSMMEMSIGSKEIIETITELNNISTQIKNESVSIKESSENITYSMEKSSKISLEVTNNIEEVDKATREITDEMFLLTNLSNENNAIIKQLSEQVKLFKA